MHASLLPVLLDRLTHPAVRDLAWVLLSPPLMDTPTLQRHPLAASCWMHTPSLLADWLLDPQTSTNLESSLAQAPIRRLGLYYERLWQFALDQAPDVKLVGANLPVRREGQTLGEFDLLIEDREGLHHAELAVKFYLGVDNPDGATRWVGPGVEDRLDLKLARLRHHQLALSHTPEGQAVLGTLGLSALESHYWLGGYLFARWGQNPPLPSQAHPAHLRGDWLRAEQWPLFHDQHAGLRWQPLARQQWLAPLYTEQPWERRRFDDWLNEAVQRNTPQLLAGLRPSADRGWVEARRIFWTPLGWPQAAG